MQPFSTESSAGSNFFHIYRHEGAHSCAHIIRLGGCEDVVELVGAVVALEANADQVTDLHLGALTIHQLFYLEPARCHRDVLASSTRCGNGREGSKTGWGQG